MARRGSRCCSRSPWPPGSGARTPNPARAKAYPLVGRVGLGPFAWPQRKRTTKPETSRPGGRGWPWPATPGRVSRSSGLRDRASAFSLIHASLQAARFPPTAVESHGRRSTVVLHYRSAPRPREGPSPSAIPGPCTTISFLSAVRTTGGTRKGIGRCPRHHRGIRRTASAVEVDGPEPMRPGMRHRQHLPTGTEVTRGPRPLPR